MSQTPSRLTKNEIYEQARPIIARELAVDIELVVPDAHLAQEVAGKEGTFLDSLTIVSVVVALEEVFPVHFKDEDAANLQTVQQVVDYIHDHWGQKIEQPQPVGEKLQPREMLASTITQSDDDARRRRVVRRVVLILFIAAILGMLTIVSTVFMKC